ncbi:uncharacterized protein L969DRAFT_91369 [Mixia osmundae IAM 14324]|uniref:Uncharacterized protein n=1 Tax=Mixia osmundae (strain CBS 9802 / IAM 14324 / JCM 22182 / KY 12970) TaxID=764103 RepID=G7E799_MIXOS|nr:uncharacterized protein L969DRAFT_91369 [Mixia osmundae IAM 14324]KEI41897.1 hypothetical protein L969DRAFT_91369 [Mixia osmundae IAM 14324]GAA98709.1 hypothetical protein E5Q_05397 [Mixia osmundae IAM 14324]
MAALASAQAIINTPAALVFGQPALLSYSGGTAPYFISVLPGGQTAAAALETFPTQQTAGSYTWNVDIPVGTSVTLSIRDGTGAVNYSSERTILDASGSSSASSGASSATTAAGAAGGAAGSSSTGSAAASSASSAPASSSSAASSSSSASSAMSSASSSMMTSATSMATMAASSASSPAAAATSSAAATSGANNIKVGLAGLIGAALFAVAA